MGDGEKEEIILETEGGPAFHIRWHEDGKYFTVTRGAMTLLQIGEKIAALMGKAFLSKRDNLIVLTRKKHEKLMKQVPEDVTSGSLRVRGRTPSRKWGNTRK